MAPLLLLRTRWLSEPRPLSTLALAAVWVVAFITIAEGTGRMRLAATAALGACVAMEAFQNLQWFSADPVTPAIVLYEAMTFTFVPLVLVAAANTVRSRIQLATAQATQAERLRELDARAAAHDERLRLARELHDVVANRLSAVAMRITAASHVRRAPATPEGKALDEIGREIDSALGELRSMLGTLRSDRDGTDHTVPPSLENVRELADQARRGGADVAVVVSGSPVPLPSMLDLAAYRIVQEALTNVTRHARPPHAMSNTQIARRLHIEESTAKTHVQNVLTKLGARTRVQAALLASRAGLVDGSTPPGTPPA